MADVYDDSWYGVPSYQPVYQQVQTPTYEPLTLGRAISMVRELNSAPSLLSYGNQAASFNVPAGVNVPDQVRQNMFTGPVSYPRAWLRNRFMPRQMTPYTPTVNDVTQRPSYSSGTSGGGGGGGSYNLDFSNTPRQSLNTTRTTTSSLSPTRISSGSGTTTTPRTTTLTHDPGSPTGIAAQSNIGSQSKLTSSYYGDPHSRVYK